MDNNAKEVIPDLSVFWQPNPAGGSLISFYCNTPTPSEGLSFPFGNLTPWLLMMTQKFRILVIRIRMGIQNNAIDTELPGVDEELAHADPK